MSLGFTSKQQTEAALKGTLKRMFYRTMESQKPVYKECGFEEDTTKDPFEDYSSMTGLGLAPAKKELAQIAVDVPKQNGTKRISLTAYALMMPISEEARRFGKYKEMTKGAKLVAESLNMTVEYLAADVFGKAFSTTQNLSPIDSKPLVSDTHKLGGGGTFSNYLGSVSFSQTSLEQAIIVGRKLPNDRGMPIGVPNGDRLLVINEDYTFEAERILNSTNQSDTANNAINTLKGKFKVAPNRFLPSTSNWFIRHQAVEGGLIILWETKPEFREGKDDKTRALFFDGYMMVAADWFEPRAVLGSDV